MYYKLDIASQKITTISSYDLYVETSSLNLNDYSLISLTDLDAFINNKAIQPHRSYIIAANELYSYSLKKALPVLIKNQISIIIFLQILISPKPRFFYTCIPGICRQYYPFCKQMFLKIYFSSLKTHTL
jgi:hypothetical protein